VGSGSSKPVRPAANSLLLAAGLLKQNLLRWLAIGDFLLLPKCSLNWSDMLHRLAADLQAIVLPCNFCLSYISLSQCGRHREDRSWRDCMDDKLLAGWAEARPVHPILDLPGFRLNVGSLGHPRPTIHNTLT